MKRNLLLALFSGFLSYPVFAQTPVDLFSSLCKPASAKVDLDINNVRAGLLNAGDLWWTLATAHYQIPKGDDKSSIFNGALWFGALDNGGNLMTACMTYRQAGNDFWSGPIDVNNAATQDTICNRYDRFWKVNRAEVENFIYHRNDPGYIVPEAIRNWPGNGDVSLGHFPQLAPYGDVDGDGVYNYLNGDYPAFAYGISNDCNFHLLGDQAIWWVFNDKGNTHTETDGNAFGMEIRATAFAYHTNDELDNATFYRYQIVNRSSSSWNQMRIGQFIDVDMGAFDDDYVGCDVSRGMGYGYNGDVNDGTSAQAYIGTYGAQPPAIGIDFLQGPLADEFDLIDNDRDSILDETGERIPMSVFKYYSGDFSIAGDPEFNIHYYYFLQGRWKDGTPQTYGGNGYGGNTACSFMFPGNSDPNGWGTNGLPQSPWDEYTVGNVPSDRRFVTSVGPFTMHPGEVETVFIGVPWARDSSASGTNLTAIQKLKEADDKMQQLFDNCFNSLNCTNNPTADFTWTDNENVFYFIPQVNAGTCQWDFGDGESSSDKHPMHEYPESGVYQVCMQYTSPCGTETVCREVRVKKDKHECGPAVQRLEGKGSGPFAIDWMPESVDFMLADTGYTCLQPWYQPLHAPVKITYEDYASLVNGNYQIAFDTIAGISRWKMWRVGETDTVFADSTISYDVKQQIPQWGIGVTITQVNQPGENRNPDHNGYISGSMFFAENGKDWLTGIADTDEDNSFNWIRAGSKSAPNYTQHPCAAAFNDRNYSWSNKIDPDGWFEKTIGGTWAPYRLTSDIPNVMNNCYSLGVAYNHVSSMNANKIENLANVNVVITPDRSKWTRCVVVETGQNLSTTEGNVASMRLRGHASVDKDGRTVQDGGISDPTNPEAADYTRANGMGWFPGFAYNLETGERLNMAFGENSEMVAENGRDMIWNPTSSVKTNLSQPLFGGLHTVYVFGHNGNAIATSGAIVGLLKDVPKYDHGKMIHDVLELAIGQTEMGEVYRDAMWAGIPLLKSGHTLLETEVTIRLRVAKPYTPYAAAVVPENNNNPLFGFSIDKIFINCNIYQGDVLAFPNPFDDYCSIVFENTEAKPFTLKLYDMRGRLVRQYDQIVSDRILIYRESLEEGTYLYVLEADDVKPKTGRIVLR
jgi:PKD domain/Secretion system C-terminal sorting domain